MFVLKTLGGRVFTRLSVAIDHLVKSMQQKLLQTVSGIKMYYYGKEVLKFYKTAVAIDAVG